MHFVSNPLHSLLPFLSLLPLLPLLFNILVRLFTECSPNIIPFHLPLFTFQNPTLPNSTSHLRSLFLASALSNFTLLTPFPASCSLASISSPSSPFSVFSSPSFTHQGSGPDNPKRAASTSPIF
eukprot:TRINITY_DN2820_c2_g1_i1.p2 TRINITY_DN2820_c2_g1~~TRINITY_DN2820_c2_g1_i1.p2  ORF type:complete len:124 (-),score=4.70 TRINITY_DN2820_c2_g1_i1:34-405(-)